MSWTPTPSQAGPHFLCISAVDSIGQTSPQRCVTLLAGGQLCTIFVYDFLFYIPLNWPVTCISYYYLVGSGPQIVNLSPTIRISETQTVWTITYDRPVCCNFRLQV